MGWRAAIAAMLIATGAGMGGAAAQTIGTVISPVLTIESDRLFVESAFGQRVAREIEAEEAVLRAENRKIEAELAEEEKRLTEERPTMSPQDFRAVADAFDERVEFLRREQDKKALAIGQQRDEEQRVFFTSAQPILSEIMRESQAALIVEKRSVFLSTNSIDITSRAIERIDATLGEGVSAQDTPED